MKVLQLALKDVKILLKDLRSILLIILMPIILIIVLGISLNSLFEKDQANIPKSSIVVIDNNDSEYSKKIMDFFDGEDVKDYIEVKNYEEDRAREKLKSGDITAMIIIPNDYDKKVINKDEVKLQIYIDKGSPVEGSIVNSILERYVTTNNIIFSGAEAAKDEYSQYTLDSNMLLESINDAIIAQEDIVKDGGLTSEGKGITAMQYYSAAMVSMYILFVGMLGTSLLIEERENNTLKRLMTTEATKKVIISGKVLGVFLLGLVDAVLLILFTRFVYKVDWGNDIVGIILLTVAMSFAASGLSVFISTLFKSSKTVDIVNPAIILIMSFMGGNMFPLYEMSEMLRRFSMLLMNNWSLRGYLSLMINNGTRSIILPSVVLCCMGVLFLGAGIKKMRI